MTVISDEQIIESLKNRLSEYNRAVGDLQVMTTKLEGLNKELLASEALKSNFLSNIRNEINNPLAAILAMSELLMNGQKLSAEEVANLGHTLHTEAFYLNFQMRNIFAVADLEAGEVAPEYGMVHMNTLIERLLNAFKHRIAAKKIDLVIDWKNKGSQEDPQALEVAADSEKLYLILANLLDNAIEFNREGGKIKIALAITDENFTIQVIDNGIGIPVTAQKEIEKRFCQLETGFNKRYKGHGLGLSVVKALIELMEGRLSLESRVGKGSKFTILLNQPELNETDIFSDDGNEFLFDDTAEFEEF